VTAALRWSAAALALGAALGCLLALAGIDLVRIGTPRDALADTPAVAVTLVHHNLPVTMWPLALVGLGWPAIPFARAVGDALVAGQLLWHGAMVASALVQQPVMWRYLPHLPLEYTALAIPAAAWLRARRERPAPNAGELLGLVGAVVALLVGAAILETYLVPL
jgi:hypothetical protein